jgi:hypothetical protein
MYVPINRYRHEGEHTGRDGADGNEVSELAINLAKRPVAVQHVDEVEESVEDGDHEVSDGQVDKEVIRDGAHPVVRQDDPDDDEVNETNDKYS